MRAAFLLYKFVFFSQQVYWFFVCRVFVNNSLREIALQNDLNSKIYFNCFGRRRNERRKKKE
jgi:hypothetical protein